MEYLDQVRTVLFTQVLNSFVSDVLAVALPLMMKERNVDIVVMGFVFASMPLIMQFGYINQDGAVDAKRPIHTQQKTTAKP